MKRKINGGNCSVAKALKKLNGRNLKIVVRQNIKKMNQKVVVHPTKRRMKIKMNEEDDARVSFYVKVGKHKKFKYY